MGLLLAHRRCAEETNDVLSRIEIAKKAKVNTAEALLIVEDYTSAIQGAREIVPFVYKSQGANLNALWETYLKG